MDQITVNVYGQLLAARAELEGMVASNAAAIVAGREQQYHESHFREKAEEIRSITNQLFR